MTHIIDTIENENYNTLDAAVQRLIREIEINKNMYLNRSCILKYKYHGDNRINRISREREANTIRR